MPNWAQNSLVITGPTSLIDAVECAISSERSPVDFETIAPMPVNVDEIVARSRENSQSPEGFEFLRDVPAWYEWSVDNWGTKWNARADTCDDPQRRDNADGSTTWSVTFDTAWSPPVPWVQKIAERFPQFSISLGTFDEQDNYASHSDWRGGELVSELYLDDVESEQAGAIWRELFKPYLDAANGERSDCPEADITRADCPW
jgi:hypothetical protein